MGGTVVVAMWCDSDSEDEGPLRDFGERGYYGEWVDGSFIYMILSKI